MFRPLSRNLLRAAPRRAYAALVTPRATYDSLTAGRGALLDVRVADGGITFHAGATRLPYESVLGSDRGLDEVPGAVSRAELVESLSPEALGAAIYHRAGDLMLEQARVALGNPKATHAEAQAYYGQLTASLESPKAFAQFFATQKNAEIAAGATYLKKAYAGKPDADLDARVTEWREAFGRFVSMSPVTQNRFSAKPTDAKQAEDQDFSYVMLRQVQPVLGYELDHAAAATELKKHIKGDALKSNKAFVEQFFAKFIEAQETARVKEFETRFGKQAEYLPQQETYAKQFKSAWSWYLTYRTDASKADIAKAHSDEALKRLAGRYNANLGDYVKQNQAELAKAALAKLPAERPLFVLCAAQAHSERVAAALEAAGASDVAVVEGGADRWLLEAVPATFSAALQQKIDDELKRAMAGAPTGLQEIND